MVLTDNLKGRVSQLYEAVKVIETLNYYTENLISANNYTQTSKDIHTIPGYVQPGRFQC